MLEHRASLARWVAAVAVLAGVAGLAYAAAKQGEQQAPVFETPRGERCIADAAQMRRNHMRHLIHQRDATVRDGQRAAKQGLTDCIECHAGEKTGSVLGETGFCESCHRYAAVKIDCFECHSSSRQSAGKVNP